METTSKYVDVTNRHTGSVGYTLPDSNLKRIFARGETKKISVDELEKLSWAEGGDYILKNYLIIKDQDALSYLNMADNEPEYFYTEADVKKLLLEGTLDQLEDTLNFAPDGVIELVKSLAVSLELPDTRKRKLISDKTGLNIDTAININTMMNAEDQPQEETAQNTGRKAAPITSDSAAPARKANAFKAITPNA